MSDQQTPETALPWRVAKGQAAGFGGTIVYRGHEKFEGCFTPGTEMFTIERAYAERVADALNAAAGAEQERARLLEALNVERDRANLATDAAARYAEETVRLCGELDAADQERARLQASIDNSDVVDQLRATQITMGQTCYPERDSWACLMESAACRIVTLESQLREAHVTLAGVTSSHRSDDHDADT